MAQDFVTAREVAAPVETALQFQDAERIGEKLDEALAEQGYRGTAYSGPVRNILQLAWAVAAHKQSTRVTVYHLAYALAFDSRDDGERLAEYLESDVDRFAGGCILQTLPLGVLTGNANVLSPAVDTVRWLGEASALARKTGNELAAEHLVRVVVDGAVPSSVNGALRKAARTGNWRLNTVLGPRALPAQSSPRDVLTHIEQVEKGDAADISRVLEKLVDFEQRISDDQTKTVSRIEAALPRPLSSARLAAAILAVLILGTTVGLALTFLQIESTRGRAVSASIK